MEAPTRLLPQAGGPPLRPRMSTLTPSMSDLECATYERQHVHEVYDQIAPHFSSTRYKVRNLSPMSRDHRKSHSTKVAVLESSIG